MSFLSAPGTTHRRGRQHHHHRRHQHHHRHRLCTNELEIASRELNFDDSSWLARESSTMRCSFLSMRRVAACGPRWRLAGPAASENSENRIGVNGGPTDGGAPLLRLICMPALVVQEKLADAVWRVVYFACESKSYGQVARTVVAALAHVFPAGVP